jgi:hypothetical protein
LSRSAPAVPGSSETLETRAIIGFLSRDPQVGAASQICWTPTLEDI